MMDHPTEVVSLAFGIFGLNPESDRHWFKVFQKLGRFPNNMRATQRCSRLGI
jgi:hypothetical protein